MADKPFRILLDTTHLRLKDYKYVWINVSPRELRTISDLKNDILSKINVEQNFNLYIKDGLLLGAETIAVLREDDIVQIKYVTANPANESPKQCGIFSRKRNFSESNDSIDANSKKQKLEISSLSSCISENNFVKKSKKKKKKETDLSVNSENCSNSAEKRKNQGESSMSSVDFYPISIEQKRSIHEDVNNEDINLKKCKSEIVVLSSNGNMDEFVGKKSGKRLKKKETELQVFSSSFCGNSLEERNNQKELFINSENICCISVEQRKEQTESSITFENGYSTVIETNQSSKKSHKIKGKSKLPIVCDMTVADSGNECSSQKKESKNKALKPILFDPKKVFTIPSIDGLSSKTKFNIHQNESSSTFVTDLNSEEVNNNQSKIKHIRHKKCEEKTNTIDHCMIISNNISSSKSELDLHQSKSSEFVADNHSEEVNDNQSKKKRKRHRKRKKKTNGEDINDDIDSCNLISNLKSSSKNIDENINRKHILYSSPTENQESYCFNNTNEFPNSSTSKLIYSLDYPKMSTPAQSKICSIPDLQLSVMASRESNLKCSESYSVLPDKSTTESTALESDKENKEKLYRNLPDLTTLPVVGTNIAYKILELDESYSPTTSDYREGIVERIDPDNDELEIRLNYEIILPAKSGKFENLGKDEVPEPTIKTYDVLKWCDLIEPKLLNSLPE